MVSIRLLSLYSILELEIQKAVRWEGRRMQSEGEQEQHLLEYISRVSSCPLTLMVCVSKPEAFVKEVNTQNLKFALGSKKTKNKKQKKKLKDTPGESEKIAVVIFALCQ